MNTVMLLLLFLIFFRNIFQKKNENLIICHLIFPKVKFIFLK